MAMSSTSSSPPDASNVVHGVFPTQALRVGDGRRLTPERTAEETTRGVEEAGVAAVGSSSGERGTPGPPAEEVQASFSFIAGDDKDGSSEQSRAPFPAADASPGAAHATAGEAMTAPQLDSDGRATADAAVGLPHGAPPEEATHPGAPAAEPHAHEGTAEEGAIVDGTTHELLGEGLASEAAAQAADTRQVDPPEVDLPEFDPLEFDPPEIDPPEIDPPEIDPPEIAPHREVLRESAAQAIHDEEATGEAASRERAHEEVAAREVTRRGDGEIASREDASYEESEDLAVGPLAAQIAPPRAAAAREVIFPTLAHSSLARAPQAAAPTHGAPRPLTRALDTAARLAADANAAAAALDSLKRLLQQGLPASGEAAIPRAAPAAAEHRPQRRPAQVPPRPPPPPLPERPIATASLAAVHSAPLPPADRARFDVRGFFAGVALSCAIGIVLYLFMTAG
jgi:hypothetical protein